MPADIKLLPSLLGRNADVTAVPASPAEIEDLIRVEVSPFKVPSSAILPIAVQ
jgi:hypothetical protein